MSQLRWAHVWISALLLAGSILRPIPARTADDTARFYGTWTTSIVINGQRVTIMSVHDANGYKNFVVTPTGNTPAGDGSFSAANGVYKTSADKPNDAGVYHFLDANTVVCTNAAGQTVVWKRQGTPAQPGVTPMPGVAYSAPHDRPGTEPVNPGAPPNPAAAAASGPAPPVPTYDPALPPETNAAIAAFDRKDFNTAWRNFMAAAQQGDAEAQAGVGAMLFAHLNPPGTGYYAQCEKWLLLSANQGNIRGMDFLGQYYYAVGVATAGGINPGINTAPISPAVQQQADAKFALARKWFERSAAKGDGYAMGNLSIMLDAGVGGPRDPARAKQLRADAKSHSDANFAKRVNTDPETRAMTAAWQSGHYADALKNALERANKGDAAAQALLGRAYYEGVGVTRSYATALPWLNKAVAQDNADAIFFLGLMYEHGRGVKQDLDRSLKMFDQAAALGQRYAAMEAAGMRLQAESNRIAALIHANSSTENNACFVAGGIALAGGECTRGGETIDPYNPSKNESN